MPLALTFTVVFLTGVFLNSAQTMIYATVPLRSIPGDRATAVGWTSGMGRFGAVFGPWLGGQSLAAGHGDWDFTAFALAGASSTVLIGLAALRVGEAARAGRCAAGTAHHRLTTTATATRGTRRGERTRGTHAGNAMPWWRCDAERTGYPTRRGCRVNRASTPPGWGRPAAAGSLRPALLRPPSAVGGERPAAGPPARIRRPSGRLIDRPTG